MTMMTLRIGPGHSYINLYILSISIYLLELIVCYINYIDIIKLYTENTYKELLRVSNPRLWVRLTLPRLIELSFCNSTSVTFDSPTLQLSTLDIPPFIPTCSSQILSPSPPCITHQTLMNRAKGSVSRLLAYSPQLDLPPHAHGATGTADSRWAPSCAFQARQTAIF
jgi:hypothetical protein